MANLLSPYPPQTPLLAPVGNIPWSRWFTDLRSAVNGLLTGTRAGTGDPNGVEVGQIGDLYRRTDGPPALYVKESGDPGTSSGWISK